ncbi:MAG: hypothetical protein ACLFPA_01550 [Dichotomicrobium sp.]
MIARTSLTALTLGFAAALLAACAARGAPEARIAGTSASCAGLDREMRQLVAQGRKESARYKTLLDRYLSRGCVRR